MDKCPFWSTNINVELCNKDCPMSKCEDGCVFKLYYSENFVNDQETDEV